MAGVAASIVLHGLVIAIGAGASIFPERTLGSDRTSSAAAPLQWVHLRPPANRPAAPLAAAEVSDNARPVLAIDPPKPSVRAVTASRPSPSVVREPRASGALAAVGSLSLPGRVEATASGPGEGDGRDTFIAPRARSILNTWKAPRTVMGFEVLVRVKTDDTGRAIGPVELVRPTPDEATNQEIIYRARQLEYWPALQNGEPIAAWAEVSYRFCFDGVTAASPPSPTFGLSEPCRESEAPVIAASGRSSRSR